MPICSSIVKNTGLRCKNNCYANESVCYSHFRKRSNGPFMCTLNAKRNRCVSNGEAHDPVHCELNRNNACALKKEHSRVYETHDNGGRPFSVHIQGSRVRVSDISGPSPKKVVTIEADEIFIGKHSPNGDYNGLEPQDAEGNSVLVRKGQQYTYIGSEIYQFSPIEGDRVLLYYSDIGNSDVPYPYAIGQTHTYLMLDKVVVESSFFHSNDDIYDEYYYMKDCDHGTRDASSCGDKVRLEEFRRKRRAFQVKVIRRARY